MDFLEYLNQLIKDRKLSARKLGIRLGQSSNGFVSLVIKGKRPLPLDNIDVWMLALELTPAERRRFTDLAIDAFAPQILVERIASLEKRHRALKSLAVKLANQAGVEIPKEFL